MKYSVLILFLLPIQLLAQSNRLSNELEQPKIKRIIKKREPLQARAPRYISYEHQEFDQWGRLIEEVALEECPTCPPLMRHDTITTRHRYDQAGNRVLLVHLRSSHRNEDSTFFYYDENKRLIMQKIALQGRPLPAYYSYFYDKNGIKVKEIWTITPSNQAVYSYDSRGQIAQVLYLDFKNGLLRSTLVAAQYHRRYDTLGHKLEETGYDQQNNVLYQYRYRYDQRGRLLSQRALRLDETHKNNMLAQKRLAVDSAFYVYDSRGALLELREHYDGSFLRISRYQYDSQGRKTETCIQDNSWNPKLKNPQNACPHREVLVYNQAGRLIEEVHIFGEEQYAFKYIYEYYDARLASD